MAKKVVKRKKKLKFSFLEEFKGGPGSGHHGHAGVIGHYGGSAPGSGGKSEGGKKSSSKLSEKEKSRKKFEKKIQDIKDVMAQWKKEGKLTPSAKRKFEKQIKDIEDTRDQFLKRFDE